MRPRVVLDVSTSLAWRRPPVGIVRAEQKFARFILEQADVDVSFCRFDGNSRRYFEVAPERVAACLGSCGGDEKRLARQASPSGPGVTEASPSRLPLGRRVRGSLSVAVQRGIARLPEALQTDASLVVRSSELFLKGLYWLALRTWREALPWRARARDSGGALEKQREVRFGPDDVYVSLGLDWQYRDFEVLERLKRRLGFRTILYCYDLVPVRFPEFVAFDSRQKFTKYFVDLARVADHVIAISRATLEDYRDFLREVGADIPPLSVIHLGTDITARERGAGEPPAGFPEGRFVLCVGTIEPRKNHELLYNVWDRLVARHGDRAPRLVLVGMLGWGVDDLLSRMTLNRRLADRILILHAVSDRALVWLYEHSLFTVYPSFYEGWGLPVVESLALGKPCLASNARALLEATRGLVPTLDPLDFGAWLEHVERWAFDRDALEAATCRLGEYRPQSWHDHGEAMLGLIHQISGTELRVSSV